MSKADKFAIRGGTDWTKSKSKKTRALNKLDKRLGEQPPWGVLSPLFDLDERQVRELGRDARDLIRQSADGDTYHGLEAFLCTSLDRRSVVACLAAAMLVKIAKDNDDLTYKLDQLADAIQDDGLDALLDQRKGRSTSIEELDTAAL